MLLCFFEKRVGTRKFYWTKSDSTINAHQDFFVVTTASTNFINVIRDEAKK